MEKKMIMTAVDQYYSFDELEDHIEVEANIILQESSFRYIATVNYKI